MKSALFTLFFLFMISYKVINATTYTLVTTGLDWNNAAAWAPAGIPGPGDHAIINDNDWVIISNNITIGGFTLYDGVIYFNGTNPTLTVTDTSYLDEGELDGGNINSTFTINPGAVLIVGSNNSTEAHQIYEGITVINKGTIRLTGPNNFNARGPALLINEGLFDVLSDADFHGESFSGGTFLNTSTGIFRKSGGTDITSFSTVWWNFNNEGGTIEGLSGSIHFGDGTFNGGVYFASANGMVEFANGEPIIKGTLTGSPVGAVRFSGGTINVDSAGAFLDFQGAGLQWSNGYVYIYTSLTIPDGSLLRLVTDPEDPGYQYLRGGGTLINQGLIRQESNDGYGLAGQQSSILENYSLVEVTTDAEFVGPSGSGTGTFINRGLLKKSGSSGITEIAGRWFIQNEGGIIETATGKINILGSGSVNNGTYVAAANTEIAFLGGDLKIKGTLSGNPKGSVRFAGATVVVDSSGAELNFQSEGIKWTDGFLYIYTTLTNAAGSLMHLYTDTLDAGYQYLRGGGTLLNLGTIRQTSNDGYGLAGQQSSILVNEGLLDIVTDADFPGPSGGGTGDFHNYGIVRKSGGDGTTLFASRWNFDNEDGGTIEANSGTIEFDDLTTAENSIIKGNAAINVESITNNGIVSPGNSPGILSYIGNFNPSSTGVLDIELGGLNPGTEYDQLNVSGNANLDGTLKVYTITGFIPAVGDSFVVLTATGTVADSFITIEAQEGLYISVKKYSDNVTIVVDSVGNLVSVEEDPSTEIVDDYNLLQNYPNPFNPTTTIQFAIPENSFTRLEVFNTLGESVGVLVSENLSAGNYKYMWNAYNLPSGVYIYKITAGSFNETKKMMLIK